MITLPPNNCTICYQMYNNERSPLILIRCGHTFCKECLDILMNHTKKEIICPECKQVTSITENPGKSLPKNRGLLNLIIYNEEVNKSAKKTEKLLSSDNEKTTRIEKIFIDYELALSKIEETYNKILEEHPFLNEISDILLKKEVNDSLDFLIQIIQSYKESLYNKIDNEFEKINLIKSFRQSIDKYKIKFNETVQKFSTNLNKSLNITSIEILNNKSLLSTNNTNFISDEIIDNTPNINLESTSKEYEELRREIEFIELYNLTLKNYNKDIYDPCKFFFQNKFQTEKLIEDLKKLLVKICDFDENVYTFQLHKINNLDEKKLLKELQETCIQSNSKKLKFIFSHFKINTNFIYSEVLDFLNSNTSFADLSSFNQNNINISSQNSNNSQRNLINSNNILRNIVNPTTSTRTSNTLVTKEKIINFHNYLKLFKDKGELNKVVKYLIEEMNYLPLRFENESSLELKFIRDIEWKIPLSII